jgi:tRNA-specific 2-thiouridylase
MEEFAASYANGLTPIPCVRCNERIKFADLLDTVFELGAEWLATGHYARRIEGPDGPGLHRAADAARDQSYFLFRTTREQLVRVRFPLGDITKTDVRALAQELGLSVADKPDSQDICFVPDGNYARIVERLKLDSGQPGEIVDRTGRVLGRHPGVIHFTVGQRKGLGLSRSDEPLFVIELDATRARVVVGPRSALAVRRIELAEVNWLIHQPKTVDCVVKVRSMRPPVRARVMPCGDDSACVEIAGHEEAVAPGQACVFYETDGTRVLGGGFIKSAEAARVAA